MSRLCPLADCMPKEAGYVPGVSVLCCCQETGTEQHKGLFLCGRIAPVVALGLSAREAEGFGYSPSLFSSTSSPLECWKYI